MEENSIQFVIAGIVVYVVQKLKSRFSIDPRLCRLISVVISLAAGIGITFSWEGDMSTGWHFSGSIPAPVILITNIVKQFLMQEGGYMFLQQRQAQQVLKEQSFRIEQQGLERGQQNAEILDKLATVKPSGPPA